MQKKIDLDLNRNIKSDFKKNLLLFIVMFFLFASLIISKEVPVILIFIFGCLMFVFFVFTMKIIIRFKVTYQIYDKEVIRKYKKEELVLKYIDIKSIRYCSILGRWTFIRKDDTKFYIDKYIDLENMFLLYKKLNIEDCVFTNKIELNNE